MSRFETLRPIPAVLCFALLTLAILAGLSMPPSVTNSNVDPARLTDIALYGRIVAKMRGGTPYEETAVSMQRENGYPLHPAVTVRPPLLASFLALLPSDDTGDTALTILAIVGTALWAAYFVELELPLLVKVLMTAALASGSVTALAVHYTSCHVSLLHESWAGLLMLLSLAAWTQRWLVAAAVLGLLAALTRELALPYLAVMTLLPLWERRWTEAAAFATALATACALLAAHLHAVTQLVQPSDLGSPGWVGLGGWRFVLSLARWNLLTEVMGPSGAAAVVPLCLLGALAVKGSLGLRLFFILGGYTIGFLVFGRPDNYYWGVLIAPLAGLSLAFAPVALRDLALSLRHLPGARARQEKV